MNLAYPILNDLELWHCLQQYHQAFQAVKQLRQVAGDDLGGTFTSIRNEGLLCKEIPSDACIRLNIK